MWTAFFQADGELRHTIAVTKFSWTAEQKAKEFRERMTHPEVGLWWVWIEETGDDDGEENNEAKALSGPKSSFEEVLDIFKLATDPYELYPFSL